MTNEPLLERMVDLTVIGDANLLDLSLLRTVREVCAFEELSLRCAWPRTTAAWPKPGCATTAGCR